MSSGFDSAKIPPQQGASRCEADERCTGATSLTDVKKQFRGLGGRGVLQFRGQGFLRWV